MYCRFAPFIKRGGFGCHYPVWPGHIFYLLQAGTWLFSLLILVELLTIKIKLLFINNAKCRIIYYFHSCVNTFHDWLITFWNYWINIVHRVYIFVVRHFSVVSGTRPSSVSGTRPASSVILGSSVFSTFTTQRLQHTRPSVVSGTRRNVFSLFYAVSLAYATWNLQFYFS